MAELYKYVCPSCGANLSPREDESVVTCPFCSGVFDRREITDAQRRRASQRLAEQMRGYKQKLTVHNALEAKVLRLSDRVKTLSETPTELPLWTKLLVPLQVACAAMLMTVFVLALSSDSKVYMTLSGAALIVAMICFGAAGIKKIKLQKSSAAVFGELQSALGELTAARKELSEFDESFDIGLVAEKYRSVEALDKLTEIFETSQASTLGEGFRLFDENEHRENMRRMQEQQLDIQKRQLQRLEELSDYDFDDTYDDDDFELEETAKEIRRTIAVTSSDDTK